MKIKALMICYDHWIKEEIKIKKIINGVKQFHTLISQNYKNSYEDAIDVLKYSDSKSVVFWRSLVECLLPGMDHWTFYYEYMSRKYYKKLKFAEIIGATYYNMYHCDLTENEMLSVNSIIALPVIKR